MITIFISAQSVLVNKFIKSDMSHSIASIFERITTFRENLLSLLSFKDIISATKELNLQINDWETMIYITELRQLFCEVSWLIAVISTEVKVIIIDKDLNRLMQHRRISNVELINIVILIEFVNEINIFVSKFETFRKIFEQCTRNKLSKWNITAINKFNNDDDCYHVIIFTTVDDYIIIYMIFYFQYEIIEILTKKIHDNNVFFESIVSEVTCNKISLQYEIVIKRLFERNKLIKILKLMIEDTLNLYFCDQSLCFIEWEYVDNDE
jgi:hypothetical protein